MHHWISICTAALLLGGCCTDDYCKPTEKKFMAASLGILEQQSSLEPRATGPRFGLLVDRDRKAMDLAWAEKLFTKTPTTTPIVPSSGDCLKYPNILEMPGFAVYPRLSDSMPALHEFSAFPMTSSAATEGISLSALFANGTLDRGGSEIFDGIEIDAFSVAQDWLHLEFEPESARWELSTFDDEDLDSGWALITFTTDSKLVGYGWGINNWLNKTMVIPDLAAIGRDPLLSGAPSGNELFYFEFVGGGNIASWSGLDLNTWQLAATAGPRQAPDAIPRPRLIEPAPRSLKLYFSVPKEGPSLDNIWRQLASDTQARWAEQWGEQWRSGATIFSFEFRIGSDCEGTWSEPIVEYVPVKHASNRSYGFAASDDIDALSIDPASGVMLASLKRSPDDQRAGVGSGFYAWQITPSASRLDADLELHHYPSPLHAWNGQLLDQVYVDRPVTGPISMGPTPPLALTVSRSTWGADDPPPEPDTSCSREPSCRTQ